MDHPWIATDDPWISIDYPLEIRGYPWIINGYPWSPNATPLKLRGFQLDQSRCSFRARRCNVRDFHFHFRLCNFKVSCVILAEP